MKTTRTTKVVLLAAVTIGFLGWLASDFTTPRKTRARRINIKHNIVTTPFPAPASAQPTTAPSTPGQR